MTLLSKLAPDDVATGLFEIGRLVDHHGWIARPRADRTLARLHRGLHHSGAAGDHEQIHPGVPHQLRRRLDGRRRDGGDQVRRTPTDRIAWSIDRTVCIEHAAAPGWTLNDHGVARGHHADGVADDRAGGIGGGCDRADHPEGRPLGQRETVVAGRGLGNEDLGPGRLVGDQAVLDDLVLVPAESRLLPGQAGQRVALAMHRLADRRHDLIALGEGHSVERLERGAGRGDAFVDGLEDTVAGCLAGVGTLRRARGTARGRPRSGRGSGDRPQTPREFPRDAVDLCVGQALHHPSPFR